MPSFYSTPPPTNFFKDFRGLPGISPFGHFVSLSSPYKNLEQNKKNLPTLFWNSMWPETHFFRLKYPEPCPYINSHSSHSFTPGIYRNTWHILPLIAFDYTLRIHINAWKCKGWITQSNEVINFCRTFLTFIIRGYLQCSTTYRCL